MRAYALDVTDAASVADAIARSSADLGAPAIVVNNAGTVARAPSLELGEEDWNGVIDVNLSGVFRVAQASAREMVRAGTRGSIVNIASILGLRVRAQVAAYAASKAAAISVTQSAAMALAPDVTVNSICPGVVDTEMWRLIDHEWTQSDKRPAGSAWQDRVRGIPMKRPQTPEDLTGMAVFLASSDSDYITGQSYHVDGGVVMN